MDIKDLFKKKWYFQGFNGVPALLYGPAFSMVRDMPKFLGFGYSACVEYFEKDVCYYLYAWDDLYIILDKLLEHYRDDSKYLNYLLKENERICKEVLVEYKKIGSKNWKKLNVKELFFLWRKSNELYARLLSVSHIVEGFTLTTEDRMRELITQEFGDDCLDKFLLLITPSRHSFLTTEHYKLCLIAREIKKNGENNAIVKKLKAHQKKYYWKLNGYTSAKIVSVEYFMKEIEEMLIKKIDLDKIIADYESLPARIKERKNLIKKINNKELLILLAIQDAIFCIHDRRKECMTQAIHYLDFLLAEIGKRFSLPFGDLKYIRPSELEKLPGIAMELPLRREKSLYIIFSDCKELLVVGDDAEKYFGNFKSGVHVSAVSELRGSCASPGNAKGIVKICRGEKEIGKIEEGDVLVACMTQPEFLPAMKKAAAIITDEGGLMCHAAILCRELGIPCVIGTKIATKVLKDGDEVEVDAENGIIRKL